MNVRTLALAFVMLVGAAATARAQDPELQQTLEQLARSWARGDAAGVAALVTRAGLSLHLDGAPVGPIGPRQAAAVLRSVFEQQETIRLRVASSRIVGGAPERAFGELTWLSHVRGTTIPLRATVFFALIREETGWRVTQIRLLP